MALTPGSRLGVYEVVSSIGEGGMGQVYRARDTRLGRDVAIKILPEAFAHDVDRLARFQREASSAASSGGRDGRCSVAVQLALPWFACTDSRPLRRTH